MEFLRVAFSLFFRGEERQGSVKKKKIAATRHRSKRKRKKYGIEASEKSEAH